MVLLPIDIKRARRRRRRRRRKRIIYCSMLIAQKVLLEAYRVHSANTTGKRGRVNEALRSAYGPGREVGGGLSVVVPEL